MAANAKSARPTAGATMVLVVCALGGCGAPRAADEGGAAAAPALSVAETATTARAPDGRFISWREHRIDDEELPGGTAARGGDGLQLADFDRDGFLDVVSAHEDSGHVRLAFGGREPDHWQLVTLAEGEEANAAEDVAVADFDGDGWLDLVVACELAHLLYLQNPADPAAARAGRWPRAIPGATRGRGSFIRVVAADFDRDGDLEVVSPNKGDQLPHGAPVPSDFPLTAYSIFSPGRDPLDAGAWSEHELGRAKVPINAQPLDVDGDGDLDVIAGSRFEGRLFWFENQSEPGGYRFVERRIDVTNRTVPASRGPRYLDGFTMAFADVSGDRRVDIVTEESPVHVSWLEQPADLEQPWTIHPIGDTAPDNPTGLVLADLDGDGDLDLFVGGYSDNPRDHDAPTAGPDWVAGRLSWFQNPGAASVAGLWRRHDVQRLVRGMYDEFHAWDHDRDGDLDLFGTRGNSARYDGVFWLEQLRSEAPQRSFFPARASESRALPLPR